MWVIEHAPENLQEFLDTVTEVSGELDNGKNKTRREIAEELAFKCIEKAWVELKAVYENSDQYEGPSQQGTSLSSRKG